MCKCMSLYARSTQGLIGGSFSSRLISSMAASGCSSSVPSLPPPRPKSPPEYPDLYGKRRELAKVQMLEREISFLEEELKFVESLQPASRCCKEVVDFVVANSDPFIPTSQKIRRSRRFWKWFCRAPCFNISWICCFGCSPHLEIPNCCGCNLHTCPSCACCSMPKCQCCSFPGLRCFSKISCSSKCCCWFPRCRCPSCPDCSCRCNSCCSCPEYPKVKNLCCCSCSCTKKCCYPCCCLSY